MKKILDNRNYILLFIIIVLLFWILFPKEKTYIKSFKFDSKIITVVIYDNCNMKDVTNNIIKIYKKYEEKGLDEQTINEIVKNSDGYFDNDEADNNFLISYSTKKVIDFLKNNNIKRYMINVNGDVILGDKYLNRGYTVSIHDPTDNSILKIVNLNNKSLSTVNYNDDLNSFKGSRKEYDLVSVICDDIVTSNIVGNYIYYLSIKDGKKIISRNKCDALWYKKNKIYTSSNFSKYFSKKL